MSAKTYTPDDKRRAARILRECYGSNPGKDMSAEDRTWLESHVIRTVPSDTILDAAQRIAGDKYNWRAETDWAHRAAHFRAVI